MSHGRLLLIFALLSVPLLTQAANVRQPLQPAAPYRFVADADHLIHASLYRNYSSQAANLEIAEVATDGTLNAWPDEVRSYTPENTQTHPGIWSFRSGLIRKGHTYEARATAEGTLDLEFLDVPTKDDAGKAVRAGMSWLIRSGNAWLSNQPRRGGISKEGQLQHPEARACIACHITQFTTRAYLTAEANGYPAEESQALDRMMDRIRDNPRPLYGHPGVNWARVIYSARTVSSRVPVLLAMHRESAGESIEQDRDAILGGARFLLLSDECGAGALRPEADGARPDVSGFEIGLQTWQTFQLAARLEPQNAKWPQQAACMERLLTAGKPANVIDAAWQLVALKRIGKPTAAAVSQLLAYQRPDGRFPLEFKGGAPSSDFISFHALYALAVAGHRGPAVDKLARYALETQRADGTWKGAPDYKGFDTPFRDTQFAVMALSELYPQPRRRAPALTSIPPQTSDAWRSGRREQLQSDLVARLARDSENAQPLIEALSATLDENLGQLREWQRSIRTPENQARVEQALRADSQREATLLAEALRSGSRTTRLRILSAMAAVVGTDGFVAHPRTGNDLDAPQILADEGAVLETTIAACLDPKDSELTAAAIRAGTALSDVLTPGFTLALLKLPPAFAPAIVEAYGEGRRGRLTLARGRAVNTELRATVRQILESQEPEKLAVVLPLLASLDVGEPFTWEPYLEGAMERLLMLRMDEQVLRAASVFPHIVDGPLMRSQVMDAMRAPDTGTVRAGVDVVLQRYVVNPNVVVLAIQFLNASNGVTRRLLLDSMDPARVAFRLDQVSAYSPPPVPMPLDTNLFSIPYVQEFVLASLRDSDPQVQAAALDLTQKYDRLRSVPAIRETLASLSSSPVPRTRLVSAALVHNQAPALAAEKLLDFDFFRDRIHPILQKPGPDGRSCAMCHASNARFPLRSDANANFAAVARKVDMASPADSLILVKPLLPGTTSDGDVFRTSHNGGERWPGRLSSAEYQVILEWIRGARENAP
ncbi:MAG: hypothetical protein ABI693_11085 [Bryobacteraceae bacterium]